MVRCWNAGFWVPWRAEGRKRAAGDGGGLVRVGLGGSCWWRMQGEGERAMQSTGRSKEERRCDEDGVEGEKLKMRRWHVRNMNIVRGQYGQYGAGARWQQKQAGGRLAVEGQVSSAEEERTRTEGRKEGTLQRNAEGGSCSQLFTPVRYLQLPLQPSVTVTLTLYFVLGLPSFPSHPTLMLSPRRGVDDDSRLLDPPH